MADIAEAKGPQSEGSIDDEAGLQDEFLRAAGHR